MAAVFTVSNGRANAQTPFEQCFEVLGEVHEENVFGAIERLVEAGEQVGFTGLDLIRMLKDGMSLENLLDVIEDRMTGTCIPRETRAV
jgi:hypothetical protein